MRKISFGPQTFALVASFASFYSLSAYPVSTEKAVRLYQKLAGVPPVDMAQIEQLAMNDDLNGVADLAMKTRSFLSATVKAFASPMTNTSDATAIELNDFSATVIGMIRDDVPLYKMMYDDILYVGNNAALQALSTPISLPAYSQFNNDHYRALELKGVDLSHVDPANHDNDLLKRVLQSSVTDPRGGKKIAAKDTMGVMTTRAAGESFLLDGTNRRMIRFMLIDFMCLDMEQLHDTTIPDDRVRQDVPRNAGGDASTYINTCSGCHAGMDPLAGAFAYYDFSETVLADQMTKANGIKVIEPINGNYNGVPTLHIENASMNDAANDGKMVRNRNFYPPSNKTIGYRTVDDSWENRWLEGQNSFLGFRAPAEAPTMDLSAGHGPKSLGMVFSATKQFSKCMAQRAYSTLCSRKAPYTADESALFANIAESFEQNGSEGKALK